MPAPTSDHLDMLMTNAVTLTRLSQNVAVPAAGQRAGTTSVPIDPPLHVAAGETVVLGVPVTGGMVQREVRDGDRLVVRGVGSETLDERRYQDGAFRPVVDDQG